MVATTNYNNQQFNGNNFNNNNNNNNNHVHVGAQQHQMKASNLNGNYAADQLDDVDDDQDSEALLYKMMQQQSFLMSPMWQEPEQASNGPVTTGNNQLQQRATGDNSNENQISLNGSGPNSRKVIKLLKSYSHIHQVDDSDDQIRGTHTRLQARRPQQATNSNDRYNRNRNNNNNR